MTVCIIVILELWYRVDLRILVAFTSLQSKGQKQMPVSLLKDKQTNTYFNLKRQTNECLFQSQETNKNAILKDVFWKITPTRLSLAPQKYNGFKESILNL